MSFMKHSDNSLIKMTNTIMLRDDDSPSLTIRSELERQLQERLDNSSWEYLWSRFKKRFGESIKVESLSVPNSPRPEWFEWLIGETLDFLQASGKLSAKGHARKSPALASKDRVDRATIVSRLIAAELAKHPRVAEFRRDYLPTGLLPPSQV